MSRVPSRWFKLKFDLAILMICWNKRDQNQNLALPEKMGCLEVHITHTPCDSWWYTQCTGNEQNSQDGSKGCLINFRRGFVYSVPL